MPRVALWAAALVLAGSAGSAGPAAAQAPSPLDLVRGLREAGMPDLALEYLREVERSNPSGEVKTVLPLERAWVQLRLAEDEEDEGAKDAAIAGARAAFDAFLAAHPTHPRAAEASVALARVIALRASTRLGRVGRLPEGQRKAAAAATRPEFKQAADLFARAAKQLTDPARRRDALQAELDSGINLFRMADTFDTGDPAAVIERAKVIDAAQAVFDGLAKREPAQPLGWVARAWVGACLLDKQDKNKAEDVFKQVRTEALRNPAAADGARMADFFELQNKFLGTGKESPAAVRQVREQIKGWLDRDRYKARNTPERTSASFYAAALAEQLAQAGLTFDKDKKLKDVSPAARTLLQEAAAGYKRLAGSDNPYTDRAAVGRTRVTRLLVGNAHQPADKFTDFEQCHMAALVQLAEAAQAEDGAKRKERTEAAIRLLERCRHLAGSGVSAREANEAALQLAYTYLSAGRPLQAAVLGEHLARHGRPAGTAAKGGGIGMIAYLAAMTHPGGGGDEARAVDRERAVELARFLDAAYPADPQTDAVRYRLGVLYFDEKQYQPAFEVLGKVTAGYPGAAAARAVEGRAAYALVAARDSALTAAEKAEVYRKAVADARAVPEPPADARKEDARLYVALRTLLAQLEVLNKEYARAEQTAAEAKKKAAGFAQLDDGEKKAAGFAAEEVQLRAVYAQAYPLYEKRDYKALAARLDPVVAGLMKAGPANQGLQGEAAVAADALDRFRQEVITLALQASLREGGVGAGDLFDQLEKFGGRADALVRLVAQVRPQIEELRREKKAEEADKLAQSVVGVLEKQAGNPKLPPRTVARIGQALRGVEAYDKAIEILNKVPPAPPDALAKPLAQIADPAARDLVAAHHIARLELARAYRHAKQFDRADEVLKDALGDDKKPGWTRSLEYRKEAVLLLEDRAADAPPDHKRESWKGAVDGWSRLVREYQAAVQRPPKDAAKDPGKMDQWHRDREKIIPVFLQLYGGLQRCLARANTQLIADPAKRAGAMAKIGQRVYDLEVANEKSLSAEVRAEFVGLLEEYPEVRAGYEKAGGKAFLPAPAASAGG